MTKQYQFVIFDWDGTLMDSTARIISSMQRAAELVGLPKPSAEQVKSTIGLSMQAVISQLFPSADNQERLLIRDTYRIEYVQKDTTPSPLFEGALPLIHWLHQQQIKTAIATGKARAGLTRALRSVGLENFFEYSICADEATSKPHPDMVLRLLEQTQNIPEETIVIGDSVHDIQMAHAAKVDAIGVTTGACSYQELEKLQPKGIIQQLSQLKSFIGN